MGFDAWTEERICVLDTCILLICRMGKAFHHRYQSTPTRPSATTRSSSVKCLLKCGYR